MSCIPPPFPVLAGELQLAGASVGLGQRGHHDAKTLPIHVLRYAVQVHRSYLVTRSLDSLAPPPLPSLKPGVAP